MDYGTFRGVITLVILLLFVGIAVWAWSARRQKDFEEAANLVFSDEDTPDDKQESKQ
ncbi:CcoQ/FixQ family Cbb3-type cytochrome c oxidase assembly chaperone [Gallaecimonas xiamenensis]|uniref:Cytochrome c oxidase, cbb3-type, CcoQ subunit n=1 Tax=Gallaecimonas xiamenensis 3-C-1 TaxID=745411 RepID=K2JQI9_9GAMM|nr:CcoQ/FixQ family Cbb3-type cytochrome c oxidase assembly chaperone [Gallaecimonas xiamenensis]EKE76802.1 cytochrome c oxidase, cbb3-type, CcoQ subunit [Gallaecimonas xiamenensis 3-C-1]